MQYFRDLTVNQMIALFGAIIVFLLIAMILFGILQDEGDPFLRPTPTRDIILPVIPTAVPEN